MYPHAEPGIGLGVTRKLLPASLLMLVVSGALLATAPSASAHHPDIAAQIACGHPDQVVVSFTATSWMTPEPDRRVNTAVAIDVVVGTVVTRVTTGAFSAGDAYTFGGTVTLARPDAPVTVRATALAPFGPHGEFGSQGATRETAVLPLPACPAPVTPTSATPSAVVPTTVATTTTVPGEVLVATSSMVVVAQTTVPTTPPVVTTVPVRVEAVTFVVAPARLPETGSRATAGLAGLALALVGLGACACAIARRPAARARG
jgi:hypothetical protein